MPRRYTRGLLTTVACVLAALTVADAMAKDDAPKAPPHKTDWLYNARWGVMYHFSSGQRAGKIKTKEDWNTVIQEFDVEGLAKQLHDVGAGYLIITGAHYGFGMAPNKSVDDGKFPTRDLVPELADALARHHIRLMLYWPTGMGIEKPTAAQNTAKIVGELSKRYGKKVSGWWLDNNCGEDDLQKMIADAARSGNPDALIAFSPPKGNQRNSKYEDYTAGNNHAAGTSTCKARFIQGLQWHTLTFLGHNWGGNSRHRGAPRYDAGKAARITHQHVNGGGVITWDVSWELSGLLNPASIPILKAINEAARVGAKRDTPAAKGIDPNKQPAGPHKTDWLCEARWGVSLAFSGKPESLKDLDVKTLVKTFKDLGAGYLLVNTNMSGPRPAGDVVGDLANELAANKMRLMLETRIAGDNDVKALEAVSKRYGKKVSAWWIQTDKKLQGDLAAKVAAAARAGNPDALLTVSGQSHSRNSEIEDFTNGWEMNAGQLKCEYRFVQKLQWHTRAFLGYRRSRMWKAGAYTPARVGEITYRNVYRGGAITWQTSLGQDGKIGADAMACLEAAAKTARDTKREIRLTAPPVLNKPLPDLPKDALVTTATHVDARTISAKMDWWIERQRGMGLMTGLGQTHMHFLRALLLFDLSDVDESKPVLAARLFLHCKSDPVGNPASERNQVIISRWLRQIGEKESRWYLVNHDSRNQKRVFLAKPDLYEVDVTDIVKAWVNGGEANYGFRLSAPDLGAEWQRFSMTWKSFESGLYDATKNPKGPRLVIYQKK